MLQYQKSFSSRFLHIRLNKHSGKEYVFKKQTTAKFENWITNGRSITAKRNSLKNQAQIKRH